MGHNFRHILVAPLVLLPVACMGISDSAEEDGAMALEELSDLKEQYIDPCGNGYCSPSEDCESCPKDCGGSCSLCHNGICGSNETCQTCPSDCGACGDLDGDGVVQNDNCINTYNPSQVDCDGDGMGNVCDTENGIYVKSGPRDVCYVDRVIGTIGYVKLKIHFETPFIDTSACYAPPKYVHEEDGWWCLGNTGYGCCMQAFADNIDDEICDAYFQNNQCHNVE